MKIVYLTIFISIIATTSFGQFKIDVPKKVISQLDQDYQLSDMKEDEIAYIEFGQFCRDKNGFIFLSPDTSVDKEKPSYGPYFKVRMEALNKISLVIIAGESYSKKLTSGEAFLSLINRSIHNHEFLKCNRTIKLIDKNGKLFEFTEYEHYKNINEGEMYMVKNINGFGTMSSLFDNLE